MAREYGEYRYPKVHALTVDTYMAQRPDTPSRRSIRSVALHLIGLYLTLEQGHDVRRVIAERQQMLKRGASFTWLEPPKDMGPLTIADVHATESLEQHARAVRAWAASVWAAWQVHHAEIRCWAGRQDRTRVCMLSILSGRGVSVRPSAFALSSAGRRPVRDHEPIWRRRDVRI